MMQVMQHDFLDLRIRRYAFVGLIGWGLALLVFSCSSCSGTAPVYNEFVELN